MVKTYKVHYNKDLNIEKDTSLDIKVQEVGVCPLCHMATSPTYINGYLVASS